MRTRNWKEREGPRAAAGWPCLQNQWYFRKLAAEIGGIFDSGLCWTGFSRQPAVSEAIWQRQKIEAMFLVDSRKQKL
jgi:hypothetical protein